MKQGASRHALKERGDDLYETPAICVHAAERAGVFGWAIFHGSAGQVWEPCAGRGAISRELRKLGYGVIAQDLVAHPGADADIASGIDFEMERAAPAAASCIITNPPFKRADAFIRHGLTLVPYVIVLLRAMALYVERFAQPDGKVQATFEIITLTGWAPHESQQKPLKPGSAKMRLADALGTVERSAGDKAG